MEHLSRKKIKKLLDEIFSHYIRIKEADEHGNSRCWTCGKSAHYSKQYCGHFASRRWLATRWDERNCRTQCYACNVLRFGEQWKFGNRLDKQCGGIAERIMQKAENKRTWSTRELCHLVNHYRAALEKEIPRLQSTDNSITERTFAVLGRVRKFQNGLTSNNTKRAV